MKRLFICSFLLIGAIATVPAGLIHTTQGKDKDKQQEMRPPAKPDVDTVVVPGDTTPIRCKGHVNGNRAKGKQ